MANFKFELPKNFARPSTSAANAANRNIKRIAESNMTSDSKARKIAHEFDRAYKGTGIENFGTAIRPKLKELLSSGVIPKVSDMQPPR
ncbi:hypothetical protein [Corynebacterium sp. HMSC04H06]|uniref:hypothetical protein n=1 Tax=Corynebacterium sp. HMSC04H06 TaxID=1581050 RepID=UPI0008A55F92|nr:hypothetical protein [Corynebacterium sp. HMSC04H06]OFS24056.1 hypothetical protein HMPREF3067_00225 [Corynebacterium sp. HMSC04H06]